MLKEAYVTYSVKHHSVPNSLCDILSDFYNTNGNITLYIVKGIFIQANNSSIYVYVFYINMSKKIIY